MKQQEETVCFVIHILRNELREFIDLKGNVVGENNKVKNNYSKDFEDKWNPKDEKETPSLPITIKPEYK